MINKKKILLRIIMIGWIGLLVGCIFYMPKTFEFISNNPEMFFRPYVDLGIWFYVIEIGMVAFFLYIMQPWTWFRKNKDNIEDK